MVMDAMNPAPGFARHPSTGRIAALLILLLSTSTQGVAAQETYETHATFESRGEMRLVGEMDAQLAIHGFILEPHGETGPSFEMTIVPDDMEVQIWRWTSTVYSQSRDHPNGAQRIPLSDNLEIIERGPLKEDIVIHGMPGPGSLRVFPVDADRSLNGSVAGRTEWRVLRSLDYETASYRPLNRWDYHPQTEELLFPRPGGRLQMSLQKDFEFSEDLWIVLFGTTGRRGADPFNLETSQQDIPLDPMGWTSLRTYNATFAFLKGTAKVSMPSIGLEGTQIILGHLEGSVTGDLQIRQTTGNGTVNGTRVQTDFHDFQAIGSFWVEGEYAHATAGESHWQLDGQATFVRGDTGDPLTSLLLGSRFAGMPPAALVAVAATGLAILIFSLYNRLSRERLYDHPMRRHILLVVGREPGIHSHEVHTLIPGSAKQVQHHIDRLVAMEAVDRFNVGKGRTPRYALALNHSSARFSASPFVSPAPLGWEAKPSNVAAHLLMAVFRNPSTRNTAQALRSLGTASYEEVAAWCQERNLAIPRRSSTFARAIGDLMEVGAIAKRTHHGRVRYLWRVDVQGIEQQQLSVLAKVQGSLEQVVSVLLDGSSRTANEIRSRLNPQPSARKVASRLDGLVWARIVTFDTTTGRYSLTRRAPEAPEAGLS